MKHSQFKIGKTFWMSGKKYRCTDIGTRTVLAIYLGIPLPTFKVRSTGKSSKVTYIKVDVNSDPSWFKGPTYVMEEHVINDYEFDACYAVKTKDQAEQEKEWLTPEHRAMHYRYEKGLDPYKPAPMNFR